MDVEVVPPIDVVYAARERARLVAKRADGRGPVAKRDHGCGPPDQSRPLAAATARPGADAFEDGQAG